jgi:hypothetical protein
MPKALLPGAKRSRLNTSKLNLKNRNMLVSEHAESLKRHLIQFANTVEYYKQTNEPDQSISHIADIYINSEAQAEDGMKQFFDWTKEVNRRNRRLLRAIKNVMGRTFYRHIIEIIGDDVVDWEPMELVRSPMGEFQKENYGRHIKGLFVDQRAEGDSGDSFSGTICVQIRRDKYLKFRYSC